MLKLINIFIYLFIMYSEHSIKEKMLNCIENLENYFNLNIKMDSYELECELRVFLQFLLNYTKNELK